MKKLGTITALLLTAGSAFAGDFAGAADHGYPPTNGTAALIALAVLVIGTVVFLWKQYRKTRVPIATAATAIATMLSLHAGDFADAADRGYRAWSGRSDTIISGINALGRTNPQLWLDIANGISQRDGMVTLRDAVDRAGSYSSGDGAMPGDQIFSNVALGALNGGYVVGGIRSGSSTAGTCPWGTEKQY